MTNYEKIENMTIRNVNVNIDENSNFSFCFDLVFSLLCFAVVFFLGLGVAATKVHKYEKQLHKYPQCITATTPWVCVKQTMEAENDR